MSQRDREGRLAINIDCPTSSPPNPATAKQEPEMSRPPWGKVAGVSLTEGGNSVTIKTAYQPRHQTQLTTQINRTTHARPYNPAIELPLSEPSRCHLSPRGEAYCMNHANKTALNPLLNNPLIRKW